MSIIIVTILLLVSFFLYRSKKKGSNESFWRSLFSTITLKVVDFFCQGTPTKVVMLFLRGAFGIYTAVSIGYPSIKAIKHSNGTESFFEILFSWDDLNWIFTLAFLGIVTIVVLAYLICNKYESKSIKHIEGLSETIDETTKDSNKKINQVLGLLQGKQNEVIQHLLPITIKSISNLKIRTAYTYLTTMKNEVDASFSQNDELKAELLYWMGCCSRYLGVSDRCRNEYKQAFELMEIMGHDNTNVLSGIVFVSCREENEADAKKYAERLQKEDEENPWGWVPSLHFADDLHIAFIELKTKTNNPELVLATELMIRSKETVMLPELMKGYHQEQLTELTYDNLPLWVLNLSVELNVFIQSWKIMPAGMDMSNDTAKRLFDITDSYLNCLENTEIKNILPDTIYLHALTGFCQDKNEKWLDEMKKAPFSEGHKEIYYLSYALMLVESDKQSEALTLLKGYGDNPTMGILNYRMHVALMSGNPEDVEEVFNIAAEKQIVIYDHYLNYFISYARWNYSKVKDVAWNLVFENPLSKKVYEELLKFWANKEVNIAFLQENEVAMNANFKPYVALVYQKHVGIDEALRLAKSCVPENALDVRSYIYIEILESDPTKTKDLYHFLTSIREKGLDSDDRLVEKELYLSEKMEDFKVSLETSSILVNRHSDIPAYWEHYMIALSASKGNENEIVNSIPTINGLDLQYSQVYNIYKVLHIVGKDEEAIEFLYGQIQKKNSQELRDEFFKASLNNNLYKIISKQADVAKEGSYVLYEDNGKKEYDTVRTGGALECLIGKKPGDTAVTEYAGDEHELTLLVVYNKYFKLLQEIGKEVAANKSKSIISINSNTKDFKSKPIDAIKRLVGYTTEQEMQQEENIESYKHGDLPLIAFANGQNFIGKLYDLLFNDFQIISIPDPKIKKLCAQHEINLENTKLVLDMSSLIMLHELDMLYNVHPEQWKLFLPKGAVNQIDYAIIYETKEMPSFFGGKGVNKLVIDKAEDGDSPFVTKLKMLKVWAEKYCQIEAVEEKLNMTIPNLKTAASSVESESLIMANVKGCVLVSEDWVLCKNMASVFPAISVSNLFYVIDHIQYKKVAQFMTATNRVGQDVQADYICEQYDLMCQQKENYWSQCIENIRLNQFLFASAFDAAVEMSRGIIIPSKNMAIQALFVTVFKAALPQTLNTTYQLALLKSTNANYRQNLADAMKICFPSMM